MEGGHIFIKTMKTQRAADADVHRSVVDALESCMLVGVERATEQVRIQYIEETWIETLQFAPYYSNSVHLKTYDHATPFSDAALNSRNHRAQVFF